jgi:hypothetical protein
MDPKNRYHTDASFLWVRAESLALLAALVVALALHLRQVRWERFALVFLAIDVIGYLPGAIAWRRQPPSGRIAPLYHHLYNLTHSFLTAGVIVLTWAALAGQWEWAMLALPIHLLGDRGLFGNTYKPVELPFEPVAVPFPATKPEALCAPQ